MKSVMPRPVPMRDQACDILKQAIFSGELQPGQVITEQELCEQLRISRTPVREALMRLELEGFIVFSPRRGVIVQNAPTSSPEELFTLLGVLEGLAARWAAENHTTGHLEQLRMILSEELPKSNEGAAKAHQDMIDMILKMANSDRLKRMLAPLHEYRRHMMAVGHLKSGRPQQAAAEHWAIYEAIANRNGGQAESLVRQHLEASLSAYAEGAQRPSS